MPPDEPAPTIVQDIEEQKRGVRSGETSVFSCPACGGVLWQMDEDGVPRFDCHIGHSYGADTLLVAKTRALEQAIYEAIRGLKEKAILLRQFAAVAKTGSANTAFLIEQADQDDENARLLETHLLEGAQDDLTSIDPSADILAEMAHQMRRAADD